MQRLLQGARLARASAGVVWRAPVLVVPGLLQTAALAVVLALLLGSGLDLEAGYSSVRNALVLFAALLVSTVVGVLSGAVVVAITADRLDGGSAGLRDGWAVTRRHLRPLLAWALVSATVGAVLRALEERLGPVGRWVTRGVGVLFSLGTILVIPVIVLEGASAVPALKRSAHLLRTKFGQAVGGETGLALALTAGFFAAAALVVPPLLSVGLVAGLTALGVLVVLLLTASSTLSAVLSVELHRVSTGGSATGAFGDLTEVVPWRRQRFPTARERDEWGGR